MLYLKVIIISVISAAVMFLLTKLMGNKQISQLSMFDYIVGITIGSIAAEMATEMDEDPIIFIAAMAVYALLALAISIITAKSLRLRRFFSGKPSVLMEDGKIFRKNLKKARMDINDLLTFARLAGYSDITQVKIAVLEYNGAVSFIPKGEYRPATPGDMRIAVRDDLLFSSVIMDGYIIEQNLNSAGKDADWLNKEIRKAGYPGPESIFLGLLDKNGTLNLYPMNTGKPAHESIE